jgi:two-component system sensor histidine kinase KdpD
MAARLSGGNIERALGARGDGSEAWCIDSLIAACDELRAESRAKDEVLGLIAHELRNPVSALLAVGRRLMAPGLVVQSEQPTILQLNASASRLALQLENMLLLARGDQPELEPVLLQRLLPVAAMNHQSQLSSRVPLFDIPADLPVALGHPGWIDQILDNFLGNAEKYSPVDEPVVVSADADAEFVSVRVLDRGEGFVLDHARQLFAPFHRENSTITAPGLGLGLAVCKRMVELQGGRVWAAPRVDGGSEFGFALQVAALG